MTHDVWQAGDAYEAYVGRWSRPVAAAFLDWLAIPPGRSWLDVGCGTGALTAAILERSQPSAVTGMDPSESFLAVARDRIRDPRADFRPADARDLPLPAAAVDVTVSALALNFVPEPAAAVAEFVRVTRPGGTVAAYVWDYAGGMEMMRYFWDAAVALDPAAAELAEAHRFPLCQPDPLRLLWTDAGLGAVTVSPIEVPMVFVDFDDYWRPFLGGQGPAPGYAMSLPVQQRDALRDRIRATLVSTADGSIPLVARAFAVRGTLA